MKSKKSKLVDRFIIWTFVSLYGVVSLISTIHVIDFFRISNPDWLAICLAIAFEIGAAASLASLIALEKMNKTIIWILFVLLTAMQAMGNTYYAYTNLSDFQAWVELFGLVDEDLIYQKRLLSIISGAILPIIALGFIKSLVDYIKPDDEPVVPVKKSEEDPQKSADDSLENSPAEESAEEVSDLANDDAQINEPLVADFKGAKILFDSYNENATNSELTEVASLSDLPDYKTPIINSNNEVLNVNQNKNLDNLRIRPSIVESPDSLDMNPTRI